MIPYSYDAKSNNWVALMKQPLRAGNRYRTCHGI